MQDPLGCQGEESSLHPADSPCATRIRISHGPDLHAHFPRTSEPADSRHNESMNTAWAQLTTHADLEATDLAAFLERVVRLARD